MAQDVLDVLTVKQEDNHPELSMSVQELNEAEGQPTDDSSYEEYTASLLDSAARIELHMDYINEDDNKIQRVVDGRVASYDSTNEEITIQLNRSDTERKGEYLFEWVLVFDSDISSDQATEVQTIPSIGFFALEVKPSSQRNVGEINALDRRVNDLTVEGIVQTNTVSPFDTNVVTFPEGVAADQLDSDQNNYIEFLSSIGSEANPVPNVTHLEQANIERLNYEGVTPSRRIAKFHSAVETGNQTTTNTSGYDVLVNTYGLADLTELTNSETLIGRFTARIGNQDGTESVDCRPTLYDYVGGYEITLSELEITQTGSSTVVTSGWQEIPSPVSAQMGANNLEATVSGGTGVVFAEQFELVFATQ